jgi:hypothetical protein
MAFDELTTEFLNSAAKSGDPIRIERVPFLIEIFVRRMESFELEEILREEVAEASHTQHPLSYPSRMGRRVPTRR